MTGTMRKENGGNVSSRRWGVPVLVCLTLGLGACMNGQSVPPQPENAPAPPAAAPSHSDLPVFMEAPLGAQVTVPPAAPLAGVPTPTGARVVYVPVVVSTPADGPDGARPASAGQGATVPAATPAPAPVGAPASSGVREIYVDRQAAPEAPVAATPAAPAGASSVSSTAAAPSAATAAAAPAAGVRVPAWNPQGPEAVRTAPPLAPAPRQEARVEPVPPQKTMPEGPVATVSVPVTRTPARETAPVAAPATPAQAPAAPPSVPAWDPQGRPTAPAPAAASAPAVAVSTPAAPARASAPSAPAAPAAAPKAAPAKAADEAAYKTALATYQAKRFEDSERAFDAFLSQYPNSKLAPNALYWKGESLYSRRLYPEAIFVFKDVTARYPKHHKASDALLKAGMAYGRMNDEDNARLHYQVLLEDYPSSPAARRVKELRLLK